jgi:hypothetical protein
MRRGNQREIRLILIAALYLDNSRGHHARQQSGFAQEGLKG